MDHWPLLPSQGSALHRPKAEGLLWPSRFSKYEKLAHDRHLTVPLFSCIICLLTAVSSVKEGPNQSFPRHAHETEDQEHG